jgi:hypothetical protein
MSKSYHRRRYLDDFAYSEYLQDEEQDDPSYCDAHKCNKLARHFLKEGNYCNEHAAPYLNNEDEDEPTNPPIS